MAEKNGTNPYGMRIVGQMNNVVGLLWSIEDDKLVLYFYHRDEYNFYSCEQLEELSLKATCYSGKVNDAFSYLKQVSNRAKPSYKVYMTHDCVKAVPLIPFWVCACNKRRPFSIY